MLPEVFLPFYHRPPATKRLSVWISLLSLFFLSGCVSRQKAEPLPTQSGEFEARIRITETASGSVHAGSLQIVGEWPRAFRMQVEGPMGLSLLTTTYREGFVQMVLNQEMKFYEGSIDWKKAKTLLKVPFDPQWFLYFAFDKVLPGPVWTCRKNGEGKPDSCKSKDGLEVVWSDRDGNRRMIRVKTPTHQLQIYFTSSQTKVQLSDEIFRLLPPDGYTKEKI